jgi:hypothetical protein
MESVSHSRSDAETNACIVKWVVWRGWCGVGGVAWVVWRGWCGVGGVAYAQGWVGVRRGEREVQVCVGGVCSLVIG